MSRFLLLAVAALALPGCGRAQPAYSNFDYRVEGSHAVVPGTPVQLPGPASCLYYIADNGRYSCVVMQDGEFFTALVSDSSGTVRTVDRMGTIVVGTDQYFVYRPDRDDNDGLVWRLGTLFPQGRTGVYVDCLSYDAERIYTVREGVEQTYDYGMNVVGGRHGRPCTVQRR